MASAKTYTLGHSEALGFFLPAGEDESDTLWNFAGLLALLWGGGDNALAEITRIDGVEVVEYDTERVPAIDEAEYPVKKAKVLVETIDVSRHPKYPDLPESMRNTYASLVPGGRNSLVVLADYTALYSLYLQNVLEHPDPREHEMIRGHPGIGKSYALQYVLLRRVCAGQRVGVQLKHSKEVFMFDGSGMTRIPKSTVKNYVRADLDREDVWWLVDELPISELFQPHPPLGLMVIAASPAAADFLGKKSLQLTERYVDVWSWREVAGFWECCQLGADHTEGLTQKRWLLWCAFWRYGGVPRLLFEKLGFGSTTCSVEKVLKGIRTWDFKISKQAAVMARQQIDVSAMLWPDTTSHTVVTSRPTSAGIGPDKKLICISVIGTEKLVINDGFVSGCGTLHVLEIVFNACLRFQRSQARALFYMLSGEANGRGYLGHLMEQILHEKYSSGVADHPMRKLSTSTPAVIVNQQGTTGGSHIFRTAEDVGKLLRLKSGSPKVCRERLGEYLRPSGSNFAAIDSLYLTNNPIGEGIITNLLQMTVASTHPILLEPKALIATIDALPAEAKRWQLGCRINFVFVTLNSVAQGYTEQSYIGVDGKKVDEDVDDLPVWWPYMDQYVTGYSVDELFSEGPAQAPVDAQGTLHLSDPPVSANDDTSRMPSPLEDTAVPVAAPAAVLQASAHATAPATMPPPSVAEGRNLRPRKPKKARLS